VSVLTIIGLVQFPQLEKLEDEHISILKERSDMISQRRRADDADDLSLFLGTLPTPLQPDAEVVDDLGRTVPRTNPAAARRDRITARSARRSHRRATSAQTQTEEEGYSTDSSLPPSDKTDFTTAVNKLSTSARAILSDVRAEEFKNPNLGLGKWFGEWRHRYEDVYTGAWGGLGLVGAWEFWVRLELVGWNPIEDARRTSLDGFTWYSALHEYSRPSVEDDEELGPDGDLVSAMISTAVVPRLWKVVEGGAFDPYSTKNLRRMVDLAEQVEASVEKDSQKFQVRIFPYTKSELMVTIHRRCFSNQYTLCSQMMFRPPNPFLRLTCH
jgi:GC-rich sequence DNA-binding factor